MPSYELESDQGDVTTETLFEGKGYKIERLSGVGGTCFRVEEETPLGVWRVMWKFFQPHLCKGGTLQYLEQG